uniref:Uncharacterized protein n=1 Tax=Amphimedon queenslandica TaxID=400682 RepID=A0A1X7VSE3_AMPQE
MASMDHDSTAGDTSDNCHSDCTSWQDYLPPHAYPYAGNPPAPYMNQPRWQHSSSNTFIGQQNPSHPTRIDLTIDVSPEKLQPDETANASAGYRYVVKVISAEKKRMAKTLEWHGMKDCFDSLQTICESLKSHFKELSNVENEFDVGYITKQGARRRRIAGSEDLVALYKQHKNEYYITLL